MQDRVIDGAVAAKLANDRKMQAEELEMKLRAMTREQRRKFVRAFVRQGATKKGPTKARPAL